MRASLAETSYLMKFLNISIDSKYILEDVSLLLNENVKKISHYENLDDWEIEFRIIYYFGDEIRIFKQSKSIKSEKFKKIVIHIPLPSSSNVEWGVTTEQITNVVSTLDDSVRKYCEIIKTDFNYSSINTYVLESVKKAILHIFSKGFTLGGVKIKGII